MRGVPELHKTPRVMCGVEYLTVPKSALGTNVFLEHHTYPTEKYITSAPNNSGWAMRNHRRLRVPAARVRCGRRKALLIFVALVGLAALLCYSLSKFLQKIIHFSLQHTW